ncbi:MAG: SMP-30/gluconolactonase/LRE family protein [Rhizobiales bacterium]|nr:SMP-30/gluconolactonase/LRE family protein [Hyphomicrobiales bacterium]
MRIDVISDRPDQLGEGPLWDVREQRLYWIDSYGPAIHSCNAGGSNRRSWSVAEPIGSMALREGGQPGELRPRMNDGKVDRQGRFVAGSMDFEESEPVGRLFRLDPDLTVHTLDTGIICSNGPCWSPDGKTFYFADTGRKVIWAYDYDTGTGNVRSRRIFTSFENQRGLPDGATVDAEGFVWSCEVYSGRLIRFDPRGVVDRIVGLPVNSTTSLIFGGPDLDVAYVTSMARPYGYRYHCEREAGFVFAVHGLGVRGIEEPRFAG